MRLITWSPYRIALKPNTRLLVTSVLLNCGKREKLKFEKKKIFFIFSLASCVCVCVCTKRAVCVCVYFAELIKLRPGLIGIMQMNKLNSLWRKKKKKKNPKSSNGHLCRREGGVALWAWLCFVSEQLAIDLFVTSWIKLFFQCY